MADLTEGKQAWLGPGWGLAVDEALSTLCRVRVGGGDSRAQGRCGGRGRKAVAVFDLYLSAE